MRASRGDPKAAEVHFRRAIDAGTAEGAAWYSLAVLYREQGDRRRSRDLLRQGLEVVGEEVWRDRMRRALGEPSL